MFYVGIAQTDFMSLKSHENRNSSGKSKRQRRHNVSTPVSLKLQREQENTRALQQLTSLDKAAKK